MTITTRQQKLVEELRRNRQMRGIRMNTRVLYELWPQLFGTRKQPNGCNQCLRNDMNKFFTEYEKLEAQGDIEVLPD